MRIDRVFRRFAFVAAVVLAVVGLAWGQATENAQTTEGAQTARIALVAAIEGAIGPGATRHVRNVIEEAEARDAEVLVLRIDTPGGLVDSTREIIAAILDSTVPVIGYVAPSGAHAASAGTYIIYATHVAAMAPGTNIGAATPVQMGGLPGRQPPGEDERGGERKNGAEEAEGGDGEPKTERQRSPEDTMTAKAVNDAVAFIRSLAEIHGRNADWAERAVREAVSVSSREALELGVVEIVANDVGALLEQADGREVSGGKVERALATKGLSVEHLEPDFMTRALSILSNPNVAFLLLMIGVYGLIFEFTQPGSVGPGVVGVICLVLALYALNQLPLDYAGLALVIAGIVFMIAEAFTPTFGILGIGGLAAFMIGASMLIDTDVPAYQISWWVIGGTAAASGGILILLVGYLWRVYRRPAMGGSSASRMVGTRAEVLDWSGDHGHVWAESERWTARGVSDLKQGEEVRVRSIDGLTLVIDRVADSAASVASDPRRPAEGG